MIPVFILAATLFLPVRALAEIASIPSLVLIAAAKVSCHDGAQNVGRARVPITTCSDQPMGVEDFRPGMGDQPPFVPQHRTCGPHEQFDPGASCQSRDQIKAEAPEIVRPPQRGPHAFGERPHAHGPVMLQDGWRTDHQDGRE